MKELRFVFPAALLAALLLGGCAAAQPAAKRVILFDEGHGQMFLAGRDGALDLSELAGLFRSAGFEVRVGRSRLDDGALKGVDAVVSSGPFTPFSPDEVDALDRFLKEGGRLSLMLHIGPPAAGLLERLEVLHSNGVIRERDNILHDQPLDFWVTRLEPHPVFDDVERFGLFGGWALLAEDGTRIIARTGERAWVDLNRNEAFDETDAAGSFGVAAAGERGAGRFIVFGDDAIFQNRYLVEYNRRLAENLVRWLGER